MLKLDGWNLIYNNSATHKIRLSVNQVMKTYHLPSFCLCLGNCFQHSLFANCQNSTCRILNGSNFAAINYQCGFQMYNPRLGVLLTSHYPKGVKMQLDLLFNICDWILIKFSEAINQMAIGYSMFQKEGLFIFSFTTFAQITKILKRVLESHTFILLCLLIQPRK